MTTARVILKPRVPRHDRQAHPWVFSGEIGSIVGDVESGTPVRVERHHGPFVGYGLIEPGANLCVRIYSWHESEPFDKKLLERRLREAITLRYDVLRWDGPADACRLIFSEGDRLSGLIVDRYAKILSIKFSSPALARYQSSILENLNSILDPAGILVRREFDPSNSPEPEEAADVRIGKIPSTIETETEGISLLVDVNAGQKTGAFLDQRLNRYFFRGLVEKRNVLDLYCYTGGFSLASAMGGASSVLGIDASMSAIDLAQENAKRNSLAVEFRRQDVKKALAEFVQENRQFGAIVCDPPKFARNANDVTNALSAYRAVNAQVFRVAESSGIILTCSCSGHIHENQFFEVLQQAAADAGRSYQILKVAGQSLDHPVSERCPESRYLKAVLLRVVD